MAGITRKTLRPSRSQAQKAKHPAISAPAAARWKANERTTDFSRKGRPNSPDGLLVSIVNSERRRTPRYSRHGPFLRWRLLPETYSAQSPQKDREQKVRHQRGGNQFWTD